MNAQKSPSEDSIGVFLTASWRHLAMLNYEIDPSQLLPFVPAGAELDFWNGKTFVSLVGFRFLNTKILGVPIPFHRNFEEVNLRFYVKRRSGHEFRRGVVFIKEIVPRRAIAFVARTFYGENYVSLPMSHKVEMDGEANLVVEYSWEMSPSRSAIHLKAAGQPAFPENGSEEQFITEHYWGYAAQKNESCVEYRVAHPPWTVWKAESSSVSGDLTPLYGKVFAAILRTTPTSAFLAEGSDVIVYRGRNIFP
jgi:hypothetical protein